MSLKKLFAEFKPGQRGLGKVLGHLEADVMEIVWQGEKTSVRDVHERLKLNRDIAYTTVMTIMSRLAEKKILGKEKEGNAYLYYPIVSREDFTKSMVREVLDGLLEEYADFAYSHFVQKIGQQDEKKIEELEELIKARAKKGE